MYLEDSKLNKPLFTVIITCFNSAKTIKSAIYSILRQKFNDFELVIVDDGSSDNSVDIISSIKSDKIKLVCHLCNLGQNHALNTGLSHANGKYVAFLDSDDIWDDKFLFEFNDFFIQNPTIEVAYCNLIGGPRWDLHGDQIYTQVLRQGYLSSMITIVASLKAINTVGKFDTRFSYCQDDDFCFRLAKKYSIGVIPNQLAKIVGLNGMTSRGNAKKIVDGWLFLFYTYKDDIISYCGRYIFLKHIIKTIIIPIRHRDYRCFFYVLYRIMRMTCFKK